MYAPPIRTNIEPAKRETAETINEDNSIGPSKKIIDY
jgi:hypothetical protein